MMKSFVNWKSYFSCDAKCSRIVIDTNLWAWYQSSWYYNNGLRIRYTLIILSDTLIHAMFLRISSQRVDFASSYIIVHFCQCVDSSFSHLIVHFSLQFFSLHFFYKNVLVALFCVRFCTSLFGHFSPPTHRKSVWKLYNYSEATNISNKDIPKQNNKPSVHRVPDDQKESHHNKATCPSG